MRTEFRPPTAVKGALLLLSATGVAILVRALLDFGADRFPDGQAVFWVSLAIILSTLGWVTYALARRSNLARFALLASVVVGWCGTAALLTWATAVDPLLIVDLAIMIAVSIACALVWSKPARPWFRPDLAL